MALRRSTRFIAVAATMQMMATAAAVVTYAATSGMLSRSISPLSSLSEPDSDTDDNPRPTKRARTSRGDDSKDKNDAKDTQEGKKTRRKQREIPEPTPGDFVARVTNRWKIGPHVSSAGGVENAIVNAASVGANAFAIFLKSQRKWDSNALKDESIAKFKERMKEFGYSPRHVLPHGSYLVNLGNPDSEKREKSYQCFLDDLKRCEQLGLELYNFHPGSTVGAATLEESIALIAESINRAHKETEHVVIVLENMAGSGNVIGSRFAELGDIIRQVDDKTRVGVCLDTCHMFAAGYDITTQDGWNATMAEFDKDVGMSYLRGMHINDSKAALASRKDRHENIGLGHLGLCTFAHILSDPRTRDIPLILETPAYDVPTGSSAAARERLATEGMGVWRAEVSVLNRLSGRLTDESGEEEEAEGDRLEESELEAGRKEIANAVAKASKLRDGKGKKAGGAGEVRKTKRRKGKAKVVDEEEDVDEPEEDGQDGEDGGSCCESAH